VTQTVKLVHGADANLVKALETIEKASNRGRDLVKGLTNFSRKDLREPTRLDLNEMVREEMELLRRTTLQKVELILDLEEPLPAVMGERGTLGSALMNLCVNAVDALPAGGTLALRTRSLPGAKVELAVEDTGLGMTPAVLARAMEPFFTTKAAGKGTGLGLAMVYATVKAHGGKLSLRSQPGRGTEARIQLPALARPGGPGAPEDVPAQPAGAMRILLVDDDELIRASVPAMVEQLGHQVATAAGGREALDLVATGPELDLVILDLNMPGMDGGETLTRLRRLRPRLPVLIASGHLDPETTTRLKRDGRALSLTKPFTLLELDRKLRELSAL
jgi:CheY-like chemotaxis protein